MKKDIITLAHGSGGRASYNFINELIIPVFGNSVLNNLDDAASFLPKNNRLAYSTDSYTVKPLFFPGGDIGKLAVAGTVNDISMMGAVPAYLSVGLMIEEGLSIETLKKVLASMKKAAGQARVKVITGDMKVVERGGLDELFINTSGIGYIPRGVKISGHNARVGDVIILNGSLGDHGIAVLAQREGFRFADQRELKTDCAVLNHLVADMLKACKDIHVLRDPTRGGLSATLNEIAIQSGVEIMIEEVHVPVKEAVKGACEMLGLDIFSVANEGKVIVFVPKTRAKKVLAVMKKNPLGREASIIGEVIGKTHKRVVLKTHIGGERILDMPSGELLPRIC